jgi:hypothetical protein
MNKCYYRRGAKSGEDPHRINHILNIPLRILTALRAPAVNYLTSIIQ